MQALLTQVLAPKPSTTAAQTPADTDASAPASGFDAAYDTAGGAEPETNAADTPAREEAFTSPDPEGAEPGEAEPQAEAKAQVTAEPAEPEGAAFVERTRDPEAPVKGASTSDASAKGVAATGGPFSAKQSVEIANAQTPARAPVNPAIPVSEVHTGPADPPIEGDALTTPRMSQTSGRGGEPVATPAALSTAQTTARPAAAAPAFASPQQNAIAAQLQTKSAEVPTATATETAAAKAPSALSPADTPAPSAAAITPAPPRAKKGLPERVEPVAAPTVKLKKPAPAQTLTPTMVQPQVIHTSTTEPSKLSTAVDADLSIAPRSDAPASATTLPATSLPARQALPQQVARQMAEAFHNAPNRPVEITLSPEELGRVRLGLSASEGNIVVTIFAERAETGDLMRRHISALESAFQELGYNGINFDFGGGQTAQDNAGEGAKKEQSDRSTAALTASDDPVAIHLKSAPLTGIDIRL
ncbi:MAG: flagellar hook-length control protein FliK [Pseudomonadota bacterium]